MGYAAAIRRSEVRPMTDSERDSVHAWRQVVDRDWREAGPSPIPHTLPDDLTVDVEHASSMDGGTLCGIPESQIDLYRHLFYADRPGACPACSAVADGRS
jgi:hypothetical protein